MEPKLLQGRDLSLLMGRIAMKPFMALIAVLIFSVVELLRFGFVGDYLFLLFGSLLSGASLFGYATLIEGPKTLMKRLVAFTAFMPYLFGCYLVFYRGFWRLNNIFSDFSIIICLKAGCFILIGYAIVNGLYKLTELVRLFEEGHVSLAKA